MRRTEVGDALWRVEEDFCAEDLCVAAGEALAGEDLEERRLACGERGRCGGEGEVSEQVDEDGTL